MIQKLALSGIAFVIGFNCAFIVLGPDEAWKGFENVSLGLVLVLLSLWLLGYLITRRNPAPTELREPAVAADYKVLERSLLVLTIVTFVGWFAVGQFGSEPVKSLYRSLRLGLIGSVIVGAYYALTVYSGFQKRRRSVGRS